MCPEVGQTLITVRAELTEILQHFQLKKLTVGGVVDGQCFPLFVWYHVIPGPEKAHFLGHIRIIRMPINATRDVRLLATW